MQIDPDELIDVVLQALQEGETRRNHNERQELVQALVTERTYGGDLRTYCLELEARLRGYDPENFVSRIPAVPGAVD